MFPCASADRGCARAQGDVPGLSSTGIVRVRACGIEYNNRAFCQLQRSRGAALSPVLGDTAAGFVTQFVGPSFALWPYHSQTGTWPATVRWSTIPTSRCQPDPRGPLQRELGAAGTRTTQVGRPTCENPYRGRLGNEPSRPIVQREQTGTVRRARSRDGVCYLVSRASFPYRRLLPSTIQRTRLPGRQELRKS